MNEKEQNKSRIKTKDVERMTSNSLLCQKTHVQFFDAFCEVSLKMVVHIHRNLKQTRSINNPLPKTFVFKFDTYNRDNKNKLAKHTLAQTILFFDRYFPSLKIISCYVTFKSIDLIQYGYLSLEVGCLLCAVRACMCVVYVCLYLCLCFYV